MLHVVFFIRDKVQEAQVVQPNELFKLTKTQPALYYKPAKEPPTTDTDAAPASEIDRMLPSSSAAIEAN
ncbi:hypothetical protein BGZ98_006863 [Dissophora globulifera]|nr:hypothetical protein BGZ98_006863 [Dissophora globulifera]